MSDSNGPTLQIHERPRHCAVCGEYTLPSELVCAHCGTPFAPLPNESLPPRTDPLVRPPSLVLRLDTASDSTFAPGTTLALQHLPSAACVFLTIEHPVILGRGGSAADDHLIDLSHFHGSQHGVSRRHCQIKRQDDHLLVRDLTSTNGTYLNALRLAPGEDHVLTDGDRLILGTMHLLVAFHTC